MSAASIAEEKVQALLNTLSDVIKQERIDRLEALIWDVAGDHGNDMWQAGYAAGYDAAETERLQDNR